MTTADGSALRSERVSAALDRYGIDRVHLLVVTVAGVAMAARLYELGARVAHWDEGRVAYWTIRYMETGDFHYRPIIHGPFYHHVNGLLFETFGMTDVTMRLAVAVIGGLFPLVALLFRDRLRDVEVLALAVLLAVTPTLLYYSRFMRGDPLVGMFMFTAFATFVRTVDTGRRRYFYAGVAFTALGFTAKENAVLYLVTWAGAAGLLLDHRLFRAGDRDQDRIGIVTDSVRRLGGGLKRWLPAFVVRAVEFLAIIVYFYAPRGETDVGPGLGAAMDDPSLFPEVVEASTVGAWEEFWGLWISGTHQDHAYLPYLGDFLQSLAFGALAVCLLAIVGFLADRYSSEGPSDLVSFAFYWGFVSVLGYPIATDIMAPWATMHAVLPLAIPAAVGLGLFVRWGRTAYADRDHVSAGLSALVVLLIVGQLVGASVGAVYANPQSEENHLVQYAQPADDIHPVVDVLREADGNNEGADVLMYGEYFVDGDEGPVPREPACIKWFNALPMPWYFSSTGVDVTCAETGPAATEAVAEEQPPVVMVRQDAASDVETPAGAYESRTYRLRAWGTETRVLVHEDYADELPPADA